MRRPEGAYTQNWTDSMNAKAYYWLNGVFQPSSVYTSSITGSQYKTYWNSGSGWRELAEQGLLPPAPYSLARKKARGAIASYWAAHFDTSRPGKPPTYYSEGELVRGDIGSNFDSLFGPPTVLDNEVRMLLLRNMRGAEMNALSALGQSKQSIEGLLNLSVFLIRRIANYRRTLVKDLMADKGLSSLVKTYRRQDPLRAVRHIHNTVCDRWLEFHFGIEQDVGDLCTLYNEITGNGLNKAITMRPRVHKVKTYCYNATEPFTLPFATPGKDSLGVSPRQSVIMKRLVLAAIGAHMHSRPRWQSNLSSKLDATASGVLPALWELIPYSWVIDDFTNIGDLIEAYTTPPYPTSNSWASTLVRDELIYPAKSWSHMGYYSASKVRYSGQISEARVEYTRFSRVINVGLMPHFEWKLPTPIQTGTLWSALHFLKKRNTPFHSLVGSWS